MAGILTADIDAPLAATLGVVTTLDSILAGIPDLVDVWRTDATHIGRDANGRVSTWTGGIHGRQFVQTAAARQPLYIAGTGVDFGDAAVARGTMTLSGAAIGQMATGSIGLRVMLEVQDETVDSQTIAGQDLNATGTGVVRIAYRYVSAGLGNYVRGQIGGSSMDIDMPAAVRDAMIWMTISGGAASMTVNGVAAAAPLTVANLNLPTFAIGGARDASPALAGAISGICIAGSILTANQRAAVEWAMRNAI
ncbi:hypothetical protein [Paracoccus lutimaris]|uniref:Uncharacterized protein n=1 Tax=Paracoccus lutimaris TaxID=1490030 RepID=A0A368YBC2_9RHOB|nr:hypothetical protein [Paracoccus lutimaris]RCW77560.1 hypothetical protein DFP89_1732 [Paracoccus lutimaris]